MVRYVFLLTILGCKVVGGTSKAKENISVSADAHRASVIWLDPTANIVRYELCDPIPTPPAKVDHNCAPKKELAPPIPREEYLNRITRFLVSSRKTPSEGLRAKQIEDKLTRLTVKSATTQDVKEKANFDSNIKSLKAELAELQSVLTPEELAHKKSIEDHLAIGADQIFDEGEKRFAIAEAPFKVPAERLQSSMRPSFGS